jgi:hypothetical protein
MDFWPVFQVKNRLALTAWNALRAGTLLMEQNAGYALLVFTTQYQDLQAVPDAARTFSLLEGKLLAWNVVAAPWAPQAVENACHALLVNTECKDRIPAPTVRKGHTVAVIWKLAQVALLECTQLPQVLTSACPVPLAHTKAVPGHLPALCAPKTGILLLQATHAMPAHQGLLLEKALLI